MWNVSGKIKLSELASATSIIFNVTHINKGLKLALVKMKQNSEMHGVHNVALKNF